METKILFILAAILKLAATSDDIGYYAADGCSTNRANGDSLCQDPLVCDYYDATDVIGEVSCCSKDGTSCTRKDSSGNCLSGNNDDVKYSWSDANAMCEGLGMRLCSSQDELDLCCGEGCQIDHDLVWTTIEAPRYYAFDGCTTNNEVNFKDDDPGYFYSTNAIGQVVCCDEDGTCSRKDDNGDCRSGFEDGNFYTWAEAVEMCAKDSLTLCSSQDELNNCCGDGCQYDNRLVWSALSEEETVATTEDDSEATTEAETTTCDDTTTCSGDSCDLCGTMTTYCETISGEAREITTNGCPHHYSICTGKGVVPGCGDVGEEGSSTEASEQCADYTIPAYPVLRDDLTEYSVACEMGAIGVALNGVAFYSGAVDTDCTILDVDDDTAEWTSFDMCGGHAQQQGEYHYHFPPSCLIYDADERNPTGTGHSSQIGWAFDGFPVYGPLYTDGVDASTLTDDCGGIQEELSAVDNFKYRYYVTGPTSDLYSLPHDTPTTDQFPFTFDCYAGYTYDEIIGGSEGTVGYTDDYVASATTGYTTSFANYGDSGNYESSYLSDGECSA